MTREEFIRFRLRLGKTQEQLSQLLGVSVRAICSYEGGWRSVPPHVQRQVLFLAYKRMGRRAPRGPCWSRLDCSDEQRDRCPAREFRVGDMCWFINGTHCDGMVQETWNDKMDLCRRCELLEPIWKWGMVGAASASQGQRRQRPARRSKGPSRRKR